MKAQQVTRTQVGLENDIATLKYRHLTVKLSDIDIIQHGRFPFRKDKINDMTS